MAGRRGCAELEVTLHEDNVHGGHQAVGPLVDWMD
jgi:hypothetical protein